MKKFSICFGTLLLALSLSLLIDTQPTQAGGCYSDPVYEVNWTGTVNTGARVRDGACMEGTTSLATVAYGTVVNIIAKTDGWYKVELNDGTKGWVGAVLINVTSKDGEEVKSVDTAEPKYSSEPKVEHYTDSGLTDRVKGYILLQVESFGEAWYVNPEDGKRYYMKDGATAYEMMRAFGLGISNADMDKVWKGDWYLINRLKGKIVLQVELHGEAYYIHPKDGSVHYLKNGDEAYRIMRELSLGITNVDLLKIDLNILNIVEVPSETVDVIVEVPAGVDLTALNRYWLDRINTLRAKKGLRLLVTDQRWVDTATEWAAYMGSIDNSTHDRSDGKTMHQWIDEKGLDFTERYSIDGWVGNYFTENISWGVAYEGTNESVIATLDSTLDYFLSEGENGAHYRTIYHSDWNSVGVGFHFVGQGDGRYKVFVAFHYGSLVL